MHPSEQAPQRAAPEHEPKEDQEKIELANAFYLLAEESGDAIEDMVNLHDHSKLTGRDIFETADKIRRLVFFGLCKRFKIDQETRDAAIQSFVGTAETD